MSAEKNPQANFAQLFENVIAANQQWLGQFKELYGNVSAPIQLEPDLPKQMMSGLLENAPVWAQAQANYYQKQMELWLNMLGATKGETPAVIEPIKGDNRFNAPEWKQLPFFDYLKQHYLLTSNYLLDVIDAAKLDDDSKQKLNFLARQYIDALAPSNFLLTNPEALHKAMETRGESLREGLQNLVSDLEKGRISMTDETAFEIGKNIALTPGKVVYENDLIQLIQYTPTTEQVYEKPILFVPPAINKFYLMDLQQDNSMIRYTVSQGFTTFLISWRNISREVGYLTWDDYLEMGILKAIDVIQDITGQDKINTLGFCIGGTLLSSALAVSKAKKQNNVASLTLMTTLLEFSDVGEIGMFVNEDMVKAREKEVAEGNIEPIKGQELSLTFSSLRANDLIWQYVVNNYLKGQTPMAFDLLYWNSDSTNLPRPMHTWYLRNMYLENNLVKPNKLTMCGVPVDLGKINLPTYVMAAREDHIVPWHTAYNATKYLKGKLEFVLGASGHIAGAINSAVKNKRNYWVNNDLSGNADEWFAKAESHAGSWWIHWTQWLAQQSGKQIPAPTQAGNTNYPVIEAAPGRYVAERNVE